MKDQVNNGGPAYITLTMQQIKELAEFAGMKVEAEGFDADDMETELTVRECPDSGIINCGEESDPDSVSHYAHIAYYTDYPEEGCIGLGPELPARGAQ